METVITLIAILQGVFSLGLLTVVFYSYTRHQKYYGGKVRWYMMAAVVSHALLTLATLKTLHLGLYEFSDPWYWVVGAAYTLSDVSMIILWKADMNRERDKEHEIRVRVKEELQKRNTNENY